MGKELTQEQRDFLQQYVIGKSKKETTKITGQYVDYDRRHQKMANAVNTLEQGHPQRATLQKQLRDAETRARNGEFKEAYADLKTIKKTATGLAKGYVTGLSAADVQLQMTNIGNELDALILVANRGKNGMAALINTATNSEKCADQNDLQAASEFRRDFTQTEAIWRGQVVGFQQDIDNAAQRCDVLDLKTALTGLAHRASMMQQQGDDKQKKAAAGLTAPLLALNKKAAPGGTFMTGAPLKAAFEKQSFAFEDALKPITDMSSFQGSTDQEDPVAAFKHLDKKEKERLEKAQLRYMAELRGDAMLKAGPGFGQSLRDQAPPPRQLATFQLDDVLGDEVADVDDNDIDQGMIDRAKQEVTTNLQDFLANAPPNSDKLFDLLCKNRQEIIEDLAGAMGISVQDQPWTEARTKLIEGLADEMIKEIEANSPNKIADDGSSLTVNGVTYDQPEKIGAGGLGDIMRYLGPNGEKVIVKLLQNTKKKGARDEMANEMRMHRQIAGGENDQPHPNVLPMKGAAVGKGGKLVMLMDEAEGGDLNQMSYSMNELSKAGVLPESARTAMTQRNMQQAVRGLRAVHAQDAMHLDVKSQNYLLDDDGNVQIADFGSTGMTGDDDKVDTSSKITTGAFAPGNFGQSMSKEEEVFWLGSLLETMSSEMQDVGTNIRSGGFTGQMTNMQGTEDDGAGGKQIKRQTALDRLRNAMIDPDPAKRPSLEGVLLSSYLTDVDRNYTDEDVATLSKAVTAYNKKVGRRMDDIGKNISYVRATIEKEQKKVPANAGSEEKERLAKTLAPLEQELRDWEQRIAAMNDENDVKPLVQAIALASAPFK